jgi:ribosomal protein L29
MEKTKGILKSILATFFVIAFIFLISGIRSKVQAISDPEAINALKQQIVDVQVQIVEKKIKLIKQQINDIQLQIAEKQIELLQQKVANVQTQIAEKQKELATASPSTPNQIDLLKQQIVAVQTQIAEKQKELADLTPSASAAASTPTLPPTSLEPVVGSENVEEKTTQELSKGSLMAAVTNFFSAENFCQLSFIAFIVITSLSALALFRSKGKDKNWIPYLVILIAPFLYRGFCSNNWLILLGLSIILLIIDWMLQGRKERQAKIEFLK